MLAAECKIMSGETAMRFVVAALLLTGCASSSGVYEVSPGVYSVTSSAITSFGGAGAAKGDAYKRAQSECASKGKRMELVNQDANANFASGSADVTFRCV
jgi:uncharacterized lipoprotein YajG